MKVIALSGQRGSGKFVIVDDWHYETLKIYKWYLSPNGYVWRKLYSGTVQGKRKERTIYLHNMILQSGKDNQVDHRNLDKLDCQETNLRLATKSQNQINRAKYLNRSSAYKGVYWHKSSKKWISRIQQNNVCIYIGCFKLERHAAMAYDIAARELFGEFAKLNFEGSTINN